MASLTAYTMRRRRINTKNAGKKRKKRMSTKSTPSFSIHLDKTR